MVKRKIFDKVINFIDDKRIILIKGARRTGKTTLIMQIKKFLENKGEDTLYFSCDHELNTPFFKDSKIFYKFLQEQYISKRDGKKLYLFLDECQYLRQSAIFLKTLFDISYPKVKLIITGSSSLDLLKIKEPLTGRKIEFTLERFSFQEYLNYASEFKYLNTFNVIREFSELSDFYEIYKKDIEYHFIEYMNWGGYPEICIEKNYENKKIYLKEIVRTYIEKDIALFFKIGNIEKFNNLIKILSYQKAQLLNKSEISSTLGIHIKTLENYLNILEGTFIISRVRPYFSNVRKEISKMPKIFINDNGIIKKFTNSNFDEYSMIDGLYIENFAFNQLKIKKLDDIYYYRTISKSEIDFILKIEDILIPCEIKFRKKSKIPGVMKNFMQKYKANSKYGIVFTQNQFKKEDNYFYIPVVLIDFLEFAKS